MSIRQSIRLTLAGELPDNRRPPRLPWVVFAVVYVATMVLLATPRSV